MPGITIVGQPRDPHDTAESGRFDDGPQTAIMVSMLDTETRRFDVAKAIRAARQSPISAAHWAGLRVDVDENEGLLVVDDLEIELERTRARLPSARVVAGATVALCPRGCARRARVLWVDPLDPDLFLACRTCVSVQYATASTSSGLERAKLALARLRARLGVRAYAPLSPHTYRRRSSYLRDLERLERAERRLEEEQAVVATRIARRLGWLPTGQR